MNKYRRFFSVFGLIVVSLTIAAQSGTNSPYSQYGLGLMAEQGQGFNRGMNGLSYGLSQHNQINSQNPASYSSIDSLSFIFDVGASFQNANIKEGNNKINAKNANFEYAVAGLRLAKNLGLSFGILPYSNIGYDYYTSQYIGSSTSSYHTETYSGSGGLHQGYVGLGYQLFKGLSLGVNVSYIWGDYTKSLVSSYSESSINTLSKYYTATTHAFKFDLGAQYTIPIAKKYALTVGAVYGFGHKMSGNADCNVISTNSSTSVSDTATYTIQKGLSIPTHIGVGLALRHGDKWTIGVDYSLQKWGSVEYPVYSVDNNNTASYHLASGLLKDRHKVILGGEYVPNELSRNFFNRVHYRFGASYATPYIKVNGADGPKEYSLSAGFGIPIINTYDNRSLLNISGQWVHSSANGLITENYLRINIGITFNERWFMKWKVN